MTDETGQVICRWCKKPGNIYHGIHPECRKFDRRAREGKKAPRKPQKPTKHQKLFGQFSTTSPLPPIELPTQTAPREVWRPRRNVVGMDGWD